MFDDIHAAHAAAGPDVELGWEVAGLGELIGTKAPCGDFVAAGLVEDGIRFHEMDHLEGVLLVSFDDGGAASLVRLCPGFGAADEADGELRTDRVVGVDFFVRNRQVAEVDSTLAVAFHVAANDFEFGGIVMGRGGNGHFVRALFLGHGNAETVDHEFVVADFIRAASDGGDEGEGIAVFIEAVDFHPFFRVLASGMGLAVFGAAFAVDAPFHAGGVHQVAFVAAIDEDPCGEGAVAGDEAVDARSGFGDGLEVASGEDGDSCFGEHGVGNPGGDVCLVGPGGLVFDIHVVWQGDPAVLIVFLDAEVPLVEEAHELFAIHLIGIAEAESAGVHAADVVGGFEQDDRGSLACGGDGGAVSAGCGAVDDDVGVGLGADR